LFDQEAARELVETTMATLIYLVCLGVIKRIASAVGSPELEVTYEKIAADGSFSVKLIHAAILLDCSSATPEALVDRYRSEMSGHELTISLLRDLVIEHFYLFNVDRTTKQRMCQRLGIRYREALWLPEAVKARS
jgi:hypothetical protein